MNLMLAYIEYYTHLKFVSQNEVYTLYVTSCSPMWTLATWNSDSAYHWGLGTIWARSIQQRGHHVTWAFIGTSRKLAAYNYMISLVLWTTLEYKLVDTNGGIQKVRVEHAARSAVATCK